MITKGMYLIYVHVHCALHKHEYRYYADVCACLTSRFVIFPRKLCIQTSVQKELVCL